jgi:hypothetical protein
MTTVPSRQHILDLLDSLGTASQTARMVIVARIAKWVEDVKLETPQKIERIYDVYISSNTAPLQYIDINAAIKVMKDNSPSWIKVREFDGASSCGYPAFTAKTVDGLLEYTSKQK